MVLYGIDWVKRIGLERGGGRGRAYGPIGVLEAPSESPVWGLGDASPRGE